MCYCYGLSKYTTANDAIIECINYAVKYATGMLGVISSFFAKSSSLPLEITQ